MPTFLQQFPTLGTFAEPSIPADTHLIASNASLAAQLGLQIEQLEDLRALLKQFAAGENAQLPHALAYSGHQFGSFNPQMGDGRAHLVAELELTEPQQRVDLHLKGSGRTPYSRPGADGKAPLSAILREWVIGESLHGRGIPSSRILAVYATGEYLAPRPSMQGNLPVHGGIAIRVADSHLRVGTFEFARLHLDQDQRQELAAYTLRRHYPQLAGSENSALSLLIAVAESQAKLMAQWMGAGFVHGVMNTDNVALSGQSLDFGPCAFLENYDPNAVFSSIDTQGRYRYQNQPGIMQWNLLAFANVLVDLVNPNHPQAAVASAQEVLDGFAATYEQQFQQEFSRKFGQMLSLEDIESRLARLAQSREDFTAYFREQNPVANPLYIPRNWKLEELLQAVNRIAPTRLQAGNSAIQHLEQLVHAVSNPFEERAEFSEFAQPQSNDEAAFISFCGT